MRRQIAMRLRIYDLCILILILIEYTVILCSPYFLYKHMRYVIAALLSFIRGT